ncbi:MAG: hypothetical protein AAFR01_12855, partial [Pseudomonadota bacterium]
LYILKAVHAILQAIEWAMVDRPVAAILAAVDHGPLDRLEDRVDRLENVQDRREDRRDRRNLY